jgi:hypothetical protein
MMCSITLLCIRVKHRMFKFSSFNFILNISELEFIIKLNILFKFDSFNFVSNTSRVQSYHKLLN